MTKVVFFYFYIISSSFAPVRRSGLKNPPSLLYIWPKNHPPYCTSGQKTTHPTKLYIWPKNHPPYCTSGQKTRHHLHLLKPIIDSFLFLEQCTIHWISTVYSGGLVVRFFLGLLFLDKHKRRYILNNTPQTFYFKRWNSQSAAQCFSGEDSKKTKKIKFQNFVTFPLNKLLKRILRSWNSSNQLLALSSAYDYFL